MASASSGRASTPSREVFLTGAELAAHDADVPTRGGGGPSPSGSGSTRGCGDSDNGSSDSEVASLPSTAATMEEQWNVDPGAPEVAIEPGTDEPGDDIQFDGQWQDDEPSATLSGQVNFLSGNWGAEEKRAGHLTSISSLI